MTPNVFESTDPQQWIDAITSFARIQAVPEVVLGLTCLKVFLATVEELEPEWVDGITDQYLVLCAGKSEHVKDVFEWSSNRLWATMDGFMAVAGAPQDAFAQALVQLAFWALGVIGANDAGVALLNQLRTKLKSEDIEAPLN